MYIETYGCALNKADSALMKSLISRAGHEVIDDLNSADVVIINTCTVRKDSEEKVLRRIKQLSSVLGNRKLIIAGCMVATQPYTVKQVAPTASLISPQNIDKIVDVIESSSVVNLIVGIRNTSLLTCYVDGVIATIPIAEGCLGDCSFCIVKLARKRLRSYKPHLVINAVREAVVSGAKEVELTAQDTASYGIDLGEVDLPKLVRLVINSVDGDYMIRIGMANPDTLAPIIDEFIEVLKDPHVFKYVHIPLQSGDDRVLKIMKRRYTVDDFISLVREIKRKIPGVSIATDIIVGHPGEDDEAFENTVRVINELQIDKVHVAQYTPRPRTEAASMPQVSEVLKKMRSTILVKTIEELGMKINKEYIGSIVKTLITSKGFRDGTVVGRAFNYKPVIVRESLSLGALVNVVIKDATFFDLRGKSI